MKFSHELVDCIRMKKVATLVMLLAGLLVCKAHDTNSSTVTKGWSSIESTASQSVKLTKQSVARKQSIVVNWSLVCEDLCGAGFGSPRCGRQCYGKQSTSQFFSAVIEKHSTAEVCSVLCGFGLGGEICKCVNVNLVRARAPSVNAEDICAIICERFNIHISGCSECSKKPEQDSMSSTSTSQPDHPSTATSDTMRTEATESATTPFTTISSTTSYVDDSSTEPDWSEVCKHLCNKGEGGSLCNCDLPPLSRNN